MKRLVGSVCLALLSSCSEGISVTSAAYQADMAVAAPGGELPQEGGPRLVRTADLWLEVTDVGTAVAAAERVATDRGGYLAASQVMAGSRGGTGSSLTIRVPTETFSATVEALAGLGEVRRRSLGTEDVTAAFTDLETRIRVKEETTERLRGLLRERTGSLTDVLEVEREISRVVTELEQLKGQRLQLTERLALSTIQVALSTSGVALAPHLPPPLLSALSQSLKGLRATASWVLFAAVYLAPWAFAFGLLWILGRLVWARRRAA